MLPDLLSQLCAATGSPPPPRAAGLLRPGSQPEQILQLLVDSERAWTATQLQTATGFTRNSVTIALWRLRRLDLVTRVGEEPATTKPRALYAAT